MENLSSMASEKDLPSSDPAPLYLSSSAKISRNTLLSVEGVMDGPKSVSPSGRELRVSPRVASPAV